MTDRPTDMLVKARGDDAALGKMGSVRGWYGGLLDVQRSMLASVESYTTEKFLSFPGGWIETRHFHWSNTVESVWETGPNGYLLDLSLGDRPRATTATNLTRGYSAQRLNRILLVPPGQRMHCVSPGAGRTRSMRCILDAELIGSLLNELPEWDDAMLQGTSHLEGGKLEWVLQRMYRELHKQDLATLYVVKTLAKELSAEIVRRFRQSVEQRRSRSGGLPPWRLRLIHQRVHTDGPLPDLVELAALCNMTVRHLSRTFQVETGQTIGKFIESVMTERALALLRNGRPIGEVATRLGYATSGSFAGAFRRKTGLLPSEISRARH